MTRPHSTRKPVQRPDAAFVLSLPPDLLDRFERQVPEAERDRFVQRLLEAALAEPEPGPIAAPTPPGKRRRKPGHDRVVIAEDFNVLLDTCAFLYWVSDSRRLSARARATIADPDNRVYFSAASAMEISTKQQSGKLILPDSADRYVPSQLAEHAFERLDITVDHALHVSLMTWHHKDPFDLQILSQSILLRMPVVSDDSVFASYPVTVIWK
jgi:PIN domain nuclease of toxin-antitoxin system